MKLDILIVDFAIVAIVFIPYLLLILFGQKEGDKLKNEFSEQAQKHHLCFEEKDCWNNNIMGLDKEKAKILLVQKRRTEIATELIDLQQVRKCELLQEFRSIKIHENKEDILRRLDLRLELYNGSAQIVNLYSCEETYSQDHELKHAERWNRTINALISVRPTVDSAA